MAPPMTPMMTPCQGSTNPDAGVMVARPATAPVINPSTDGFRRVHHSSNIQGSAPAAGARRGGGGGGGGGGRGTGARGGARAPPPPAKPSQPIHNMPMPMTANDR